MSATTIIVNDETPRRQYVAAASQTKFDFPFPFFETGDLEVYLTPAGQTADDDNDILTITSDYTVSGADTQNGGYITLVSGASAGDIVTILRVVDIDRVADYQAAGDLLAETLNREQDTEIMISQQLREVDERSIRLQKSDESADMRLPAKVDRADKILQFDTNGEPAVVGTAEFAASLAGSVIGANYITNNATGDGTTVNFTLSSAPGSKGNLQIYIDGVYQNKNTFSLAGTTVTFTEAPPLNASVEFIIGYSIGSTSGDATGIDFTQQGTGAVSRTVANKLYEFVSVKDFGAVGDGVTDDTAAIQAAVTAAYTRKASLYFPSGTYLMSSTITMGNTASTAATFCHFFGDGKHSKIKVSAANVNPFLWQGPNPDVDGGGNRIDGRILLEKLYFEGPLSYGSNTNSIGVKFYGAQGITLRDCTFLGWYDGEHYQNCDIVSRYNVYSTSNVNGVNTSATGYAITGEGQLNSFNSYGGLVNNNSNCGIQYVGGLAPCFFGVNFVLNTTSIVLSPNNSGGATVTVSPNIVGCYFEGDTGTTISWGGGNGIVRGGQITGCNFIAAYAGPLVTIANYSNSYGRGIIANNTADTTFAGSSFITQTSSAEKIDVNSLNGTPVGDITPSTGAFTKVNSKTFTKGPISASGTVDILSIGSFGNIASISMTITGTSSGKATSKKYQIIIMGGGTVTGSDISSITEVYGGGGSPFTLSETKDSPSSGTNKLTITNNDTVASTYRIVYTVEDITGTLTIL